MDYKKIRVIALYLPQFHPIPENDKWWGKGFTDWKYVGKARPLFIGHYQPRVPADLGYYDLRLKETRIAQAEMAHEFGVEGFCYWHYWFGNGKRLLERPFNEVLTSGEPNFPFCLGWANHSWMEKKWSINLIDKVLIQQSYNGFEDYKLHFYTLLPAFLDNRYITVRGKPFFLIFRPLDSPEIKKFIQIWRKLAKENGLEGIYFVGQGSRNEKNEILNSGFDAFNENSVAEIFTRKSSLIRFGMRLRSLFFGIPRVYSYKNASDYFCSEDSINIETIPIICPNWDHSPRSGKKAFILHKSTPKLFKNHVIKAFRLIINKPYDERIVILKSWNEWGEGNYIEPDLKFGRSYLEALKESLDEL